MDMRWRISDDAISYMFDWYKKRALLLYPCRGKLLNSSLVTKYLLDQAFLVDFHICQLERAMRVELKIHTLAHGVFR